MDISTFTNLLQQHESETLDFKQELPTSSDLAVLISAFYNTHGGTFIIGVDDEHRPIGVDRPQSVEAGIANIIQAMREYNLNPPIVDETHRLGKKVAAHAIGRNGIKMALDAGCDSIEHGDGFDDALIAQAARQGTFWCPTMLVTEYVAPGRAAAGAEIWLKMLPMLRTAVGKAAKAGVKIALGTDAGGFPWTINQAGELKLMVNAGMSPMQALKAATLVAADLLDQEANIGSIEVGKFADIIAVPGDPLQDISVMEKVNFVMKNGKVYVNGSQMIK